MTDRIASLSAEHPGQHVYSVGKTDIRLVYYMGRPVVPLTVEKVQRKSESTGLLFVQQPLAPELLGLASCKLGEIEQYLKRDRSALLIQRGTRCR